MKTLVLYVLGPGQMWGRAVLDFEGERKERGAQLCTCPRNPFPAIVRVAGEGLPVSVTRTTIHPVSPFHAVAPCEESYMHYLRQSS